MKEKVKLVLDAWKWLDRGMHYLVRVDPQAFIDLLLGEGKVKFVGHILSERLDGDYQIIDVLLDTVIIKGKHPLLLHIEFEKLYHAKMRQRLKRYNDQIVEQHKGRDTLSGVFHLDDDKDLDPSPLICGTKLEGWEEVTKFAFPAKEMKHFTPEEIRALKRPALHPLLPFTRGGNRWEVVQGMLHDLEAFGDHEMLKIGFLTAWHKGSEETRNKLKKEFRMIYEELREDSLLAEFLKDSLEDGIRKGVRQVTRMMRQAAIGVVASRFPALQQHAQKSIKRVKDPQRLEQLTPRLSILAQQEIEEILAALDADPALDQSEEAFLDQAVKQAEASLSDQNTLSSQEQAEEALQPDQGSEPNLPAQKIAPEQKGRNEVTQTEVKNPAQDS